MRLHQLPTLKELAINEFAALAELEKHLGIELTAKEIKRKALRDFKKSIGDYLSMREFEKNKQHFRTIRPEVPAIDEEGNASTVRKETYVLGEKAQNRVNIKVSECQTIFKKVINGDILNFDDDNIQQRAIYILNEYEENLLKIHPTKKELIRVFLTWIRELIDATKPEAIKLLQSYGIPSLKENDIPSAKWTPLQPNSITFRTFEL